VSELTQKDYDAVLIAELLDGPLNIESGVEKAASVMASAARRIQFLQAENKKLREELKELRLQNKMLSDEVWMAKQALEKDND